jgi:hypothetical protein
MAKNVDNNNVLQDRFPASKPKMLNLRSDNEKIILYMKGELKNTILSSELEEKINRMKAVSDLITKHGGGKKTIGLVQERYDLSYSAARRLCIDTQEAFGDITSFNRQYHIDTFFEMLVDGINKSLTAGDFKAYATMLKEYRSSIDAFMGDNQSDLYKNLQVPKPMIGFYPEELKIKLPKNYLEILKKISHDKNSAEIEDAVILQSTDAK